MKTVLASLIVDCSHITRTEICKPTYYYSNPVCMTYPTLLCLRIQFPYSISTQLDSNRTALISDILGKNLKLASVGVMYFCTWLSHGGK